MRTNKNCPKYGEDKEDQQEVLEETSAQPNLADAAGPSQPKTTAKKLIPKLSSKTSTTAEPSEGVEKVKPLPVKFKLGQHEKSLERNLSITVVSENKNLADPSSEINKPAGKINKLIISNKPKPLEDLQSPRPSIVIRPPAPADVPDSGPRKKIIIKQPRDHYQTASTSATYEVRKMKRIAELAPPEANTEETADYHSEGSGLGWRQDRISEDKKYREEQRRRLYEARMYEEAKRKEEMERRKLKKKKKKKHDFTGDDYLKEHRAFRKESRRGLGPPERERSAKRRAVADLVEHGSSAKRRRGGEVHEIIISDFSIDMVLLGLVSSAAQHCVAQNLVHLIALRFVQNKSKKKPYKSTHPCAMQRGCCVAEDLDMYCYVPVTVRWTGWIHKLIPVFFRFHF